MNKLKMKKLSRLLLSLLMLIGCIFNSINSVKALDSYTGPFTKIKEVRYPSWMGKYSTWMCTFNNQISYCLEASKKTPDSGNKTALSEINTNELLKKCLYYGYGGPADILTPILDYDDSDGILFTADDAYVATHIVASYVYSGDLQGCDVNATFGKDTVFKWFLDYITNAPSPIKPTLGERETGKFVAEFDRVNKEQKTNLITFNAASNAAINVTLQDNVTLHNVTKGMVQTGGIVKVYGGDQIYLTAPMTVTEDYMSENIAGEHCNRFVPLLIKENDTVQGHGSYAVDPAILHYSVDWLDTGSLELSKTNDNKDMIDGAVFNLKSISYDGYDEDITVKDGMIRVDDLMVGTYELKEISAPEGYLINTEKFTVTINKNITTTQVVVNKEPRGSIFLTKEINTDLTDGKKGDAILKGNEYRLIAREKISNKAGTITYFNKGDLVDTKITDDHGKLEFNDLYIGNYYIEESDSNKTLVLNPNDVNVNIEYEGQLVSKVLRSTNVSNRVNMQKIQIHKSGEKDGISGIVKGLQGAEFTFRLKSEVDRVGWDNAVNYDVITTDENGRAHTKYLPYGVYIVRETKTPQDYLTAPDFIVSVTKDYSEYIDVEQIKIIDVNNRPATTQLKIVKKDLTNGKVVTLNSATFKVRAREDIVLNGKVIYKAGEAIKQKISGKIYDSFTTNADNVIVPSGSFNSDGDMGSIILPLQLDVGKYYIDEIKTPTGYLSLEKPVDFIIENIRNYDKDQNGDPVLTVIISNDKPVGQLKVFKSIDLNVVDKSFIKDNDLSKIRFRLTAKENILDVADGRIIYEKNTTVGEYNLNKDGSLLVSNLPMGIYELQEISTLQGLVQNGIKYEVKFIATDLTTKVYTVTQNIVNKPTLIEISKTAVTGEQELEGASMQLLDNTRNVIAKWISGNKPYIIEGLETGKTYILREDLAPLGYVQAKEISFIIENTSEIQKIHMIDKVVNVKKIDTYGKAVEGAHLQVVSTKTKNIVDQWIVDESGNHNVKGLEVGNSYILKELQAPDGYVLADEIEFTVKDDGKDQIVEMINNTVKAVKQDEGRKLLKGATLQVRTKDSNKLVDQWVSGEHIFNITEEMKTLLQRGEVVNDIFINENDIATPYKIIPNNDSNDYTLILQINERTQYYNIDIDGNETSHLIRGLKENEQYVLKEILTPEGYVTADNIEFEVNNKDIILTMINELTKVEIAKIDITNAKELSGAQLILEDITTGEAVLIERWITANQSRMFRGLIVGHTYRLSEEKAPVGYKIAQEIEFTVKDTNNIQRIEMIDELLPLAPQTSDDINVDRIVNILWVSGIMLGLGYLYLRKKEYK